MPGKRKPAIRKRRTDNLIPAFQFYPSNWLSSDAITMMTPEQEGAYIRLLARCWNSKDCTLPDDDASLAVFSRLADRWLQVGMAVRKQFVPVEGLDGRITNLTLRAQWKRLMNYRERASKGGQLGIANRWKKGAKEEKPVLQIVG